MRRVLTLTVISVLAMAGRAGAIEMFTNFNNGQNIGFPPLEVPTRIYGGFGHGGWNPHAEGMPLKTNPPVPAMMPTGQIPGGRTFDYYGRAPSVIIGNDGAASQRELVSDRRRARWQRGGAIESRNGAQTDTNTAQATDAKDASSRRPTSGGTNPTGGQQSAVQSSPTILHAQSEDFSGAIAPFGKSTSDEVFQDWPKADALFPH